MPTFTEPPQSAQERWRPIPNHTHYWASNQGRIWSARAGRVLKPDTSHRKYQRYCVARQDGKRVRLCAHQMVAAAWLGAKPEGMFVLHSNDIHDDNSPGNLYYGTYSDNQFDAVANNRHYEARRTHCQNGHEFTDVNTRMDGRKRRCRACSRQRRSAR
ncbi:NUMOD4 domain-containing protein [Mycobacteroides chelonae]|uniref:NUMOD4 domain-containing protein n=1 Tax=Mycobacteroides chelonae TaxID=1774 RepID=UPI0035646820